MFPNAPKMLKLVVLWGSHGHPGGASGTAQALVGDWGKCRPGPPVRGTLSVLVHRLPPFCFELSAIFLAFSVVTMPSLSRLRTSKIQNA